MSDGELKVEMARMKRRLGELEAANGLRSLAPADEDGQTLAEVCSQAGIGVRTLQSESRERDTVRKRHVVAAILRKKHGWIIKRIASAMRKTERAVRKML